MEVPRETLAEMGEEPPLCQGGVAEKVDQSLQRQGDGSKMGNPQLKTQGGVAEKVDQSLQRQGDGSKMDNPQLNTQDVVADKMDDPQLQPVPPPPDTTSHPQQTGGGAEVVQPVYHSPSLEDEEMLQTSVEESLMPFPATSHMGVTETSLVRREWYPKNSELVLPTTK